MLDDDDDYQQQQQQQYRYYLSIFTFYVTQFSTFDDERFKNIITNFDKMSFPDLPIRFFLFSWKT